MFSHSSLLDPGSETGSGMGKNSGSGIQDKPSGSARLVFLFLSEIFSLKRTQYNLSYVSFKRTLRS
jgi:hypothetical protein